MKIKSRFAFLFIFFIGTLNISNAQDIPKVCLNSITPAEMKKHVYYLASDEMRGRDTPSSELDSCAAYIAKEFSSYGLKPVGVNQSYFQSFNLLRTSLSEPNALSLNNTNIDTTFRIKYDFVPLYLTANRKISAPVGLRRQKGHL